MEEADCSRLEDTSDVFCHTTSTRKKNLLKLDRLQHKTKVSFPGKGRLGLQEGASFPWAGEEQQGERGILNWGKSNKPVPGLVAVAANQRT